MPETPHHRESVATSPERTRAYAELSGDFNPLHLDAAFAADTPFGGVIVHGSHTLALVVDWLERQARGRALVAVTARFVAPVPVGTRLVLNLTADAAGSGDFDIRVLISTRN